MKNLGKLLCVSVVSAGVLFAGPSMDMGPMKPGPDAPGEGPGAFLRAPKGVLPELYNKASIAQKRQIMQIEFDARKAIKTQTEKFRQYRDNVEFDIKNLRLDYEQAVRDDRRSGESEILARISKKQAELRKNKQDEDNLKYVLEEEKIRKINEVLKVK